MQQQKNGLIFISFACLLSLATVAALSYLLFFNPNPLSQLYTQIDSLSTLLQIRSSLEAESLLSYLEKFQSTSTLVNNSFLQFNLILSLFILMSTSFVLYQYLNTSEKYEFSPQSTTPRQAEHSGVLTLQKVPDVDFEDNKNRVFTKAIQDLKCATEALAKMVGKATVAEIEVSLHRYEHYYNRIVQIAAAGNLIGNEIQSIHKALAKTNKRLQSLAHQCRESANFAATTQLDWKRNTMINNLRQTKESHDKVHDTANHISSIHQSSQRLLQEVLGIEGIFFERSQKVISFLQQVQDNSKPGFKELNHMVTSMSDSKEKITTAASLVNGLSQRAEAIITMVHMIDDLAEQINLQALNASVEAARIGLQGQNFAQISDKLCKLTSRSSVVSQSISELLSSIQEETNKANQQLNTACDSMENAFTLVSECGDTYRAAVSASKYAFSEINLLENEFSIHLNKLREVAKLGDTGSKFFRTLSDFLVTDDKMSTRINEETNKLTAHSDRLSQLLAKQYYELNHCEKMVLDTMTLMEELEKQATENKHMTLSLKIGLEEFTSTEGAIPLDDSSQRIASRHLTLLKNSTETLECLQLPEAT